EMLELDMSLDADLGIDSIKRVEILSAIQEKLPELPALQPEQLGSLQTLRQIVEAMGSVAASISTSGTGAAVSSPAAVASGVDVDVSGALLEVVAEKTGYPQEMLELDMSLDADLGIDSIKRVEILSAIQEKLPELPALQPEQLASLQTLRQIVEAIGSVAATTPAPESTTQSASIPTDREQSATPLLQRQIIQVVPVAADRPALKLNSDAPIWVVDDCSPLSAAVVTQLKQRNFQVQLISPGHNEKPEQLAALVIVAPQIGTDSYFLRDAFLLMQRCGDALKHSGVQGDSSLITVSHLDGQCGFNRQSPIIDPLSGGLAGISKTAHHEWPQVNCKALDLGADLSETAQVDAIVSELLCAGPVEVGANRGGRVTLTLTQHDLSADSPSLQLTPTDVVVISGGARGVTAEVAEALAKAGQPTLLLLGRSARPEAETDWLAAASDEAAIKNALMIHAAQPLKPRELNAACQKVLNNRELLDNLQRLQQAGSRVIYRSVDIRDDQAVSAAIDEVREFGTISGLIHGAGVLADRKIEDKTAEQFALVYSTKIAGLQALLHATQNDPLAFIALFSSSTARFGRTGQIDYAVANEVLNKSAQALARQRNDCRVVSLNWGPWDGGMVTPALKKIFADEGIEVIDLQLGAQYLLQELVGTDDQVELVILGGAGDGSTPESTESKKADASLDDSISGDLLPNTLLTLTVSSDDMPFLQDHVINSKAVVPMAMLVEWLAQGALHNNPGLLFHGFDNLRIRKGLVLEDGKPLDIELRCGALNNADGLFVIPMQICNQVDGTIYASADIVLADSLPQQRPAIEPLVVDGGEIPTKDEIYASGKLFHGSKLQGLKQVIGNNNEGIIALSATAPIPSKWMDKPLRSSWITDPQVIDSSFQMMILWSFAQKELGSLPSFAGHYRQYCEQFPVGTTRIQCRVTKASKHSATANIDFIDEQSRQLLARIDGYECTMTEALEQAFYNNKLHR
ncbi:MAG: SDR family NAD(P)-dependent oxidoreductase, partial [Thermodesulfobacteriota bacterium]|nr:SDR family NAD(P)-dependent oxidoreductase [Thermodesulfobacteriota bacterium]